MSPRHGPQRPVRTQDQHRPVVDGRRIRLPQLWQCPARRAPEPSRPLGAQRPDPRGDDHIRGGQPRARSPIGPRGLQGFPRLHGLHGLRRLDRDLDAVVEGIDQRGAAAQLHPAQIALRQVRLDRRRQIRAVGDGEDIAHHRDAPQRPRTARRPTRSAPSASRRSPPSRRRRSPPGHRRRSADPYPSEAPVLFIAPARSSRPDASFLRPSRITGRTASFHPALADQRP